MRKSRFPIPNFTDIAKLIAPDDPPSWLPAHLGWWSDGLRYDQMVDEVHPSTRQARDRLAAIAAAAELIARELESPVISALVLAASPSKLSVTRRDMQQLASRAESARLSPPLVSTSGKTKRGRGKPKVPNIFDARTLCATRIVVMWRFFRKTVPGIGNLEAAAAAQAYWLACGGRSDGHGDPLNGWYDYFKAVRDNSGAPGLKQFIWWRDLEQAKRRNGSPCYPGTNNPIQEAEIKSPILT
ncbi:hypothetical protein [Bradyrhizobium sp. 6(2017)]|uniref:hypothetical protein n=1 Tax=Bradyrhizobium sp. 6(2017) TaxID=1197460 RepID=UPI0013E117D7|nr:hypothetical protein [Bradyrhizobium sp. 6(2017)]QIG98091.1 hypothetical protein G6P99_41735 [Bradyrhizobium sp. 6(2017)]